MREWFAAGDGFMVVGIFCLGLALLTLLAMLGRILKHLKRKQQGGTLRWRLGMRRIFFRLLIMAALSLVGIASLASGFSLRGYQVFTRADLVATINCLDRKADPEMMTLDIQWRDAAKKVQRRVISFYGEEWELSAQVIKWNPLINIAGMHTGYQLQTLRGVYPNGRLPGSPDFSLALNPEPNVIGGVLNRMMRLLPGVESVYRSAVSSGAAPGETYEVLMTTSGLTLRSKSRR
jgi:hypothetical protein